MNMNKLMKRIGTAGAALALGVSAFSGSSFSLPAGAADAPKLYMALLAGGSQLGIEFTLKAPEGGSLDGYSVEVNDKAQTLSDGKFSLTADYAYTMDDAYTIQIYKGTEKVGAEKTISVSDYLNQIRQDENQADFHDLADSILLYGQAAKAYWKDGETPDLSAVTVPKNEFTTANKTAFNSKLSDLDAPFSYYGMNLALFGELRYNLFFKIDGDKTFDDAKSFIGTRTPFGDSVIVDNEDGFFRLQTKLPASALEDAVAFSWGGNTLASFTPSQYLYAATTDSDAKLSALCKALYAYGSSTAKLLGTDQPGSLLDDGSDEPDAETYSGSLTCYSYSTGCAMIDDYVAENGCPVAALTDTDYEKYVGGWIEITYNGKTLNALVADIMPVKTNSGKQSGDVDLDEASFKTLTGETTGILDITWKPIASPNAADGVKAKFKQGSSQGYTAVQFQNCKYPIATVEYGGAEIPRMRNDNEYFVNFYVQQAGLGADSDGSYTFTLTDIYGNQYEATAKIDLSASLSADKVVDCTVKALA